MGIARYRVGILYVSHPAIGVALSEPYGASGRLSSTSVKPPVILHCTSTLGLRSAVRSAYKRWSDCASKALSKSLFGGDTEHFLARGGAQKLPLAPPAVRGLGCICFETTAVCSAYECWSDCASKALLVSCFGEDTEHLLARGGAQELPLHTLRWDDSPVGSYRNYPFYT